MPSAFLSRLISASWLRGSLVLSLLASAFCSLSFPVAEAAQLGQEPQQVVSPVQLADYANQLAITLDGRSMLVEPQEGGWSLDMQLESVAWNGVDHTIAGQANITTTTEIFYNEPASYTSKWDLGNPEYSFQEYYHSMSLGVLRLNKLVEETFDLDSEATFPVTLTYQLTSDLTPQISDAGRGVRFLDANGLARLNYQMLDYGNNLIVSDEIQFQLNGQRLLVIANQASDHTDFGQQLLGTSRTLSYTIVNSGSQSLALNGVTLSGSGASQFSLVSQPKASLAAGESTTFEIAFTPNAVGSYSATVTIQSDDSVSSAYTFAIAAEAIVQTTTNYQIYLPIVRSN